MRNAHARGDLFKATVMAQLRGHDRWAHRVTPASIDVDELRAPIFPCYCTRGGSTVLSLALVHLRLLPLRAPTIADTRATRVHECMHMYGAWCVQSEREETYGEGVCVRVDATLDGCMA
jgi:hypothetical protein